VGFNNLEWVSQRIFLAAYLLFSCSDNTLFELTVVTYWVGKFNQKNHTRCRIIWFKDYQISIKS